MSADVTISPERSTVLVDGLTVTRRAFSFIEEIALPVTVKPSASTDDLSGEIVTSADTIGLRPVPDQDPARATLLLSTPHFGESGKNHRPFFRKGFADTRYCPM